MLVLLIGAWDRDSRMVAARTKLEVVMRSQPYGSCKFCSGGPRACGHSIGRLMQVLSADQVECLQHVSAVSSSPGDFHKPCLLIVSPYVRASLGLSFPILSYNS